MPTTQEHVQALFSEHAAPTHADKTHVQSAISSILDLVTVIHQQQLLYRHLIDKAQLADATGLLDGKFENLHQTFGAAQADADAITNAARNLARHYRQLDRYMERSSADFEKLYAVQEEVAADGATSGATTSVVTAGVPQS